MTRRPVSPLWVVLACGLWMAAAGNLALWRRLGELGLTDRPEGWVFGAGVLLMIWSALTALLGLFAWRSTLKPAATLLLASTAVASHFMLSYRVVIDATMMVNLLQTDVREAEGLVSGRMALTLLLLLALPCWALWRQPVDHGSPRRQWLRNSTLVLVSAALFGATLLSTFHTLAPVMRNHKDVRYLINPLNSLYALGRVAWKPMELDHTTLVQVGSDAHLRATQALENDTLQTSMALSPNTSSRPKLLLLVLGETGRSGNFGLNGYERDTTPELQRETHLASFRNAWSCGTSTAASVPCMFSKLTRAQFENRKVNEENLLDVLQRAGLAVLWLDNQSGCKGVCDRVPSIDTTRTVDPQLCATGECLDGVMLKDLDARIEALDPVRRARGVVLVMHQMGSHGPAYHQRSPAAQKRFLPECTSISLQDCSRDSVVNAYDNSIAYTDHFLAQTIHWLQGQTQSDTAMLYVADHGESLGENNLYLHGLPYSIAPDVQKRVPWITWLSPGYQQATGLSLSCLRKAGDTAISHDHYFHSVLGLMGVQTGAYRPELDAYAGCR